MKKILILLPIIGIYSSLFAQAPKVENVNANQKEGTKYVIIKADISGKEDPGGFGAAPMYFEVWFKQTAAETTWQKVNNLKQLATEFEDPDIAYELAANESDDGFGGMQKVSFHLTGVGSALTPLVFAWDAGAESSEFQSSDAVIRIIAFYPKIDEFGATPKPAFEQVSGWNGIGEFTLGGDPGAN
jgi:hypothetical protein